MDMSKRTVHFGQATNQEPPGEAQTSSRAVPGGVRPRDTPRQVLLGPARNGRACLDHSPGGMREDGQRSFTTHASQRGNRASQTRRPCQIRRCGKTPQYSRGTSF
jgi:hypothetical protein